MNRELINWTELTKLSQGEEFEVERVRIKRTGIAIEGRFELPALMQLSGEDQVFVAAFLRSHGSIKEMERLFGISYPTVKGRLARIAEKFPFVETVTAPAGEASAPQAPRSRQEILDLLEQGKISTAEAVKLLRGEDPR